MIACDEIISVMDIVSTKMTNTVATNMSISSNGKKVRYEIDCHILHTVFSDNITIDNHYYLLSFCNA